MDSTFKKLNQKIALRKRTLRAQLRLWRFIRGNTSYSHKFCRQHSLGPYTLPFYCPSERLCIEVVGELAQEETSLMKDILKSRYLDKAGIRVVQFTNSEVIEKMDWVLTMIHHRLESTNEKEILFIHSLRPATSQIIQRPVSTWPDYPSLIS